MNELLLWHALEHVMDYLPAEHLIFCSISKYFSKLYLGVRPDRLENYSNIEYYLENHELLELITHWQDIYSFIKYFVDRELPDTDQLTIKLLGHEPHQRISCADLDKIAREFSKTCYCIFACEGLYRISDCPDVKKWTLSSKRIYVIEKTVRLFCVSAMSDNYKILYKNKRYSVRIYCNNHDGEMGSILGYKKDAYSAEYSIHSFELSDIFLAIIDTYSRRIKLLSADPESIKLLAKAHIIEFI